MVQILSQGGILENSPRKIVVSEFEILRHVDRLETDCFHFSVRLPEFEFGTAFDEKLALKIAIHQYIERQIFSELRDSDFATTTSGFAVHKTEKAAIESSESECLERDALISHWLLKIPPRWLKEVDLDTFHKEQVKLFEKHGLSIRFGIQSISNGKFCIVAAMTGKPFGIPIGFAFSASCNANLQTAILSTIKELRRSATVIIDRNTSGYEPWDPTLVEHKGHHHFSYYLNPKNCDDLNWFLKGNVYKVPVYNFELETQLPYSSISLPWRYQTSYSKSNSIQNFYFGCAQFKRINRNRIKPYWKIGQKLNKRLHILP